MYPSFLNALNFNGFSRSNDKQNLNYFKFKNYFFLPEQETQNLK